MPVDEILRFGDKDFAIIVAKDEDERTYAIFQKLRSERLKRKGRPGKRRAQRPSPEQ